VDLGEGEDMKAGKIKRWSFAEQRRLMVVAASSNSFEEMVDQVGRKPGSVRKMVIQLGIKLKPKSVRRLKASKK
jgi:hypothetical protein